MIISDYIDGMSSGVFKTLFTMLDRFIGVCTTVYEYGNSTLHELIIRVLDNTNIPEIQIQALDKILSGSWAWIYNITILEILMGSTLIAVILFGIIKYFTDIVF